MGSLKIGVCGLGTVGSGVVNIFNAHHGLIQQRCNADLQLVHIGARRDNPNCDTSSYRVSRDVFDVVRDPTITGGSNINISNSGRVITINSTASSSGPSTNISAGNGISVGGGSGNYSIAMLSEYPGNYGCSGSFTAAGNVTAYSDDRLKVRDGEVVNALGKVKEIDTFYYTPSAAGEYVGMPDKRNAGVSAQQVQEVFPEAVIESEGYLAVDYGRLVILCLEAIKQLSEDRD